MNPPPPASAAPSAPLADALVLVFTAGVSLREWDETGQLAREWALYRELAPAHYPRLVAVTHGDASDRDVARRAEFGPHVHVVCNERAIDPVAYAAEVPDLVASALAGARTAVVKTNQFKGGLLAVAIARSLRARSVRTGLVARAGYLWSRHVARQQGFTSTAAVEAASHEGELCRDADLVVASAPTIGEDVCWRYSIDPARLRVVPNYVLAEREGVSTGEPGESDPNLLLCVGRLHEMKRPGIVLRAAAKLRERAGLRLVLVGDGPERASLERLARELRITPEFRGRLPHSDVLGLMRRCAVFVQTSKYEGHPKTVLEAMGAGAPVVIADTPGLGDVVADGHTGVKVECPTGIDEDVAASRFATAISGLLNDPAARTRLGRAAAEHVRSKLSLTAVVPLELAAHRAALDAGSKAPEQAQPTLPPVRWDPSLLKSRPAAAIAAFERGIHGYIKRLPVRDRCEFLFGLDWPLYQMQGMAAGELEGGLHPKHRLLRYHDFFVSRVRAGEHVIDLGCGNGALMCSIASRAGEGQGASVTGIELNEQTAARARARAAERNLAGRVTVHQGDITTLRAPSHLHPPHAFDVLVLSNVLEHIDRRPERLAQWREWYAPKRWLIRVPAFDREWRTPFKKELGVEWRLDVTHETEYTRDQLERELAQAGLTIDELIVTWGEYWCSATDSKEPA